MIEALTSNLHNILIALSGGFLVWAYFIYYKDVSQSKIQPSKISWALWCLSSVLETFTYNYITTDPIKLICFIFSTSACIVLTSRIWSISKWEKPGAIEKGILIICVCATITWFLTQSAWVAHVVLLVSIPLGFVPTLLNAIKDYRNENFTAWVCWGTSDLILVTVILIRLESFQELPYAVVEFGCHITIVSIICFQKFRIRKLPKIRVGKNHLGKAVFANQSISKREVILKFSGEIIAKDELPPSRANGHDHFMQIGIDIYLGPSGKDDDYVNHSCDPNAGVQFKSDGIYLIAIKSISPGEEITWDYSTTLFKSEWSMVCDCRTSVCRKVIRRFSSLD